VLLAGALVLIIFLVWFVSRSGFFDVRSIHIANAKPLTDSEVITDAETAISQTAAWKSHTLGFKNMLTWPDELTGSDLVLSPQIADMKIAKDYWGKQMTITIQVRTPAGIWCTALSSGAADTTSSAISGFFSCFTIDNTGFTFANAPHAEGGLVHVIDDYTGRNIGLATSTLPSEFIVNLFSAFHALQAARIGVREVRLENLALQELRVTTYDGPDIYFSLRFNEDDAAAVLSSLKSRGGFSNLGYVDFRVQNRAYYK
jgi:hypothetical protein